MNQEQWRAEAVVEKTCKKCLKTLAVSSFHINKENKDGRRSVCKSCKNDPLRKNNGHGMNGTPTQSTWCALRKRCDNPKTSYFFRYGGRGISYDPKWKSFKNFLADMGVKPDGMEIDRINNDLGYSKENCRWVTKSVNGFNRTQVKSKHGLPRGVTFNHGKYQAKIKIYYVTYGLGAFLNMEDAKSAYDSICLEWYGQLAPVQQQSKRGEANDV